MKVMFEPAIGTAMSYRGSNQVVKQTSKELPKKAEGYTNEEIYNAIMSFKKRVTNIFPRANTTQPTSFNRVV